MLATGQITWASDGCTFCSHSQVIQGHDVIFFAMDITAGIEIDEDSQPSSLS